MQRIKPLSVIAMIVLVLCSCVPQSTPVTETPVPTVVSPAATVTLIPVSSPTPTVTSVPDWVMGFAGPILKTIENQPPKFQDDFSDPNSNWTVGKQMINLPPTGDVTHPGRYQNGETGYINGEYFTIAAPKTCIGGDNPRIGVYQDFVAEFDVRFVSGSEGDWEFHFHMQDNPHSELYALNLIVNTSYLEIQKSVMGESPETWGVGQTPGGEIQGGTESNHILLIVRGTEVAVYANGTPVLHIVDKPYSANSTSGTFSLVACHMGNDATSVPMEIRWDNLKFWDISGIR
jgi:hypothetical protein